LAAGSEAQHKTAKFTYLGTRYFFRSIAVESLDLVHDSCMGQHDIFLLNLVG